MLINCKDCVFFESLSEVGYLHDPLGKYNQDGFGYCRRECPRARLVLARSKTLRIVDWPIVSIYDKCSRGITDWTENEEQISDPNLRENKEVQRQCLNCEYFKPKHSGSIPVEEGECRRNTPSCGKDKWPMVSVFDWCASFEPKWQ